MPEQEQPAIIDGLVVESDIPRSEPVWHEKDGVVVFEQEAIYSLAVSVDDVVTIHDVDVETWATNWPGDSIRLDCTKSPCVEIKEDHS
jgi:hypothetical protein